MALRNLLLMTRDMPRLFVKPKPSGVMMRVQPKSELTPMGGWFGEMFSVKTIMTYWEIIPIIVTFAVTSSLPVIFIAYGLTKWNDIKPFPSQKMKLEKHNYIIDGSPVPRLKLFAINQKFEWPAGLIKALKDDGGDCCAKKAKKVSFQFWPRR